MFVSTRSCVCKNINSPTSDNEYCKSDSYAQFAKFKSTMSDSLFRMYEIARKAQDVSINMDRLEEVEVVLKRYIEKNIIKTTSEKIVRKVFRYIKNPDYPTEDNDRTMDWLFVLNTMNFSLWNARNTKQWTVHGLTGFNALCYAIKRAIKEGRPIWNPKYYSKLKQTEVEIIFRSDDNVTQIPLIHQRIQILHKNGKVLLDKYRGTFINCVLACNGDALQLRYLLFNEFESYRDMVDYEGEKVYIGCKAETLIRDLSCFNKIFKNLHSISTMFVDHCAPQVLLRLGILRYSDRLTARFAKNDNPLEYGSREEIEIRCCSLVAIKKWSHHLMIEYRPYIERYYPIEKMELYDFSITIDNFLWTYRHTVIRSGWDDAVPFHNVRSVYY